MGWRNEEPICRWVTRRAGPPDAGISARRAPGALGRRMPFIRLLQATRAMGAWEFYAVVLLVYLGTNLLSVWGLNLQFGVSGVANLAYIVMVAAGAYTYA